MLITLFITKINENFQNKFKTQQRRKRFENHLSSMIK